MSEEINQLMDHPQAAPQDILTKERKFSRLYLWAMQKANSPKAPLWLGLLFSLELILFIPLDAVLMFFCLQKRNLTFLYITIAALASLFSGAIGYLIGHYLWDLIGDYVVPHLISVSFFQNISNHLQHYENGAVFFGALLPLPLKALSVVSGVFHLGLLPFIVYFTLARFLRFGLIGCAMAIWGTRIKKFIERHFHRIILAIGVKVALILFSLWALTKS